MKKLFEIIWLIAVVYFVIGIVTHNTTELFDISALVVAFGSIYFLLFNNEDDV